LSELEDPIATLIRLIKNRISVVKEDGTLAKVLFSEQSLNRELLLKEYDAQVTLAIGNVEDRKLNLKGTLRRRVYTFGCTVHAIDRPVPNADLGKVMRRKVTEQILAVIRENRNLPYETVYNFVGLGYPNSDPHKALSAANASESPPSSTSWAELSAEEYQKIWYSDELRYSRSVTVSGQYAQMLLKFKIGSRAQTVRKLTLTFEGYGIAPAGNGLTLKLWNKTTGVWQQTQTSSGSSDETLTITISANCTDFVDSQGYIYVIARTTNPSNGATPTVIYCNFTQLAIQVYGITYCDVLSYRPVDMVDVKPFLFKESITLRGYTFDTISEVF
jgi:hypothetical protein